MRKTLTASAKAPAAREYEYDFGLFNGRFQLIHEGHLADFRIMAEKCHYPIINIGSINQARDTLNPLDFWQRQKIWQEAILGEFGEETFARTSIIGQEDLGNRVRWASAVESKVSRVIKATDVAEVGLKHIYGPDGPSVAIFGHRKDQTSFYLDDFPNYTLEEVEGVPGFSSTDLREQLFDVRNRAHLDKWIDTHVPYWNANVLHEFIETEEFQQLLIEKEKQDASAQAWSSTPYPVIFDTADAVVVQGNRILLTLRDAYPGKGLWALGGGYVGHRERVLEAAIRHCIDKTGIDVSKTVLRNSLVDTFYEDNPWRSTNGRIITFVSIFVLKPSSRGRSSPGRRKTTDIPHVRNNSAWFTFDEVRSMPMRSMIFEDHAILIERALERLGVR